MTRAASLLSFSVGFAHPLITSENVIQSVTELTQLICHEQRSLNSNTKCNQQFLHFVMKAANCKGKCRSFQYSYSTWGDWDEKCGNFMTASHYFSVLHSSFCTRKSGFTILSVSFISRWCLIKIKKYISKLDFWRKNWECCFARNVTKLDF